MRFIHFSDCHIGGWRDEKMSQLGLEAFKLAIEQSISKKPDFVLIAGDIFNTALPGIDKLKEAVIGFKKLNEANIPCYVIAGSHDFSPSGKTMIDVLEHAGLLVNVCKGTVEDNVLKLKFTIDPKTNAKITGIIGKKGMLDKKYYEHLDRSIEQETGFKIFMFHTALTELKPKELEKMDSAPVSLLPKGFDYYAGGHVHIVAHKNIDGYQNITYPGALFPNNFREIEELRHGGYYLYEDGNITWHPISVKDVVSLYFDCDGKTYADVEKEIMQKIKETSVKDSIVTVRVKGELASGKATDIQFNEIFGILYHKEAYFVMKSTSLVTTKEFEAIQTTQSSVEDMEEKVISENAPEQKEFVKQLMSVLSAEKHEGETKTDFEKRLIEETNRILN